MTRPPEAWYSVEEVAERLGLHPRTVRNHIRDGRLRATRVGRQFRVAAPDLDRYTRPAAPATPQAAPHPPRADVSAVVHVDFLDRATADRLVTAVLASVHGDREAGLGRVEAALDPDGSRLRFVVLGPPEGAARVLLTIHDLLGALAPSPAP